MKHRYPALFFATLYLATWPAYTHELPLLFQERYLYANVTATLPRDASQFSQNNLSWDVSAFTGDFPLLIQADRTELSIYTGSTLFVPVFLSGGTTNQIGYLDSYREHTPLALLSAGWRPDLFPDNPTRNSGWFAAWGWRSGLFSGGFGYYFDDRVPVGYLGASLQRGGIGLSLSPGVFEASLTVRTNDFWSIGASMVLADGQLPRLSVGFGFSRKDYAADTLLQNDWDLTVAHRGSLQHAPENTEAAFDVALAQPRYAGIETDIQKTADGNFVLVHDPIFFRYTGKLLFVEKLTTEEVKALDMGSWFSREFAGQQIMELADFSELCNRNPDIYWLMEIKSHTWTEEDVVLFLTMVDRLFEHPEKLGFYTLNRRVMALMQKHTDRPVGLQLDSRNFMLFLSDHLLPLVGNEYRRAVEGADFFTILSSKYDRYEQIAALADELEIPVIFWNFHDIMMGHVPDGMESYPLGMPKMESGEVLK